MQETDKLDHTFVVRKTKQGYRAYSNCSYPDSKRPKTLVESIKSNYDKLEKIDMAIRGHYFRDNCKHESNEKCRASILHEVIEITGYQPRTTLVTSGIVGESK